MRRQVYQKNDGNSPKGQVLTFLDAGAWKIAECGFRIHPNIPKAHVERYRTKNTCGVPDRCNTPEQSHNGQIKKQVTDCAIPNAEQK